MPSHFTGLEDVDRAFRDIKPKIVNSPGRSLFDPKNEVIVTTDSSGAVLTQVQNDGSEVQKVDGTRT